MKTNRTIRKVVSKVHNFHVFVLYTHGNKVAANQRDLMYFVMDEGTRHIIYFTKQLFTVIVVMVLVVLNSVIDPFKRSI